MNIHFFSCAAIFDLELVSENVANSDATSLPEKALKQL